MPELRSGGRRSRAGGTTYTIGQTYALILALTRQDEYKYEVINIVDVADRLLQRCDD